MLQQREEGREMLMNKMQLWGKTLGCTAWINPSKRIPTHSCIGLLLHLTVCSRVRVSRVP